MSFNDSAKWAKILIGTGSIPSITADIFQATCSAAGDIAGLVTVAPQDLSSCDIRFYADRRTARTALVLRIKQDLANPLPDEVEYMYAIFRNEYGYGLTVYNGYGWLYYTGADPVAPSNLAEMRIVISEGIIHFYYNGIEVYNETSRIPPESLYIYLLAIATTYGTTIGTTTFMAVPLPLAIDVTPKSASLQVGQSQLFTAVASGGQTPLAVRWIDNATGQEIGIGSTYTFTATLAGNFEIYAQVTDNAGTIVNSTVIQITVVEVSPPPKKWVKAVSEIRGVFVHESIYSYAHDWNVIAQTLKQYRINSVFVSDAASLGRRPDSEISAAIAAFHANGIEYHSSIFCLGENKGFGNIYCAIKSNGEIYNEYWQCPIKVHDEFKRSLESYLNTFDVDGIMLDYIRYNYQDMCYCPQCRAAFQTWLGEGVITDWTPFYPDGSRWLEYAEWRNIPITTLVKDIRSWALAIKPNLKISEAAWTYFSDCPIYWRKFLGQDTGKWIKEGYLDFVAPMMYTQTIYGTSGETLESEINANLKYMTGGVEGKIPLLAFLDSARGITVQGLKDEVDYVRSRGLDGWILWRYGGPGDSEPNPDITQYLAVLDLPETFTINNINMTKTNGSITISWTTDKPASSKVEYSASPLFYAVWSTWGDFNYWWIQHAQGSILEDSTLKTAHNITIPTATDIYFRVQSQNILGKATSLVYYTTELPPPPTQYTLTISTAIGGTTNPAPGTYSSNEGAIVPVTALPDINYRFLYWELDGVNVGSTNPINIAMNANHTLNAVFEYVPPPPLISTIKGYVKDAATDKPIIGAIVACDGYADVTEIDGLYELKDVPAATYTLTVQKEGYKPQTFSVDTSSGGIFTRDVSMEPEAPPTAPPTFFDRAWTAFTEFSGRLNLPVPPKPAQPPKLPIEE